MRNPVDPPFEVGFEFITPDRARELLAEPFEYGDLSQRNLSHSRVARYAEDIENDWWNPTHQGIALDPQGRVMDGQHRLQAIIQANRGATMLVAYGVPPEVFWLIDGGFTRNAQSFLDGQYRVQRTALARTMMRLEEMDGIASMSTVGNAQYPAHHVLKYIEGRADVRTYGEGFSRAAVAATKTRGDFKQFAGTSTVGLLVGGFIVGQDRWTEWWEDVNAIVSGDGLETGNPVKALWLASPVGGNMTNVNYMRAIYAAVKYRDGEELRSLRSPNYHRVKVW